MVGESDSAHDALFVGLVLVDGIAGGWLAQAASSPHPACCVVRQTECDLLGHHRAGTSLFVEPSAFSDVADQQRHDKSPALISGAPDRCAVLCSVVDKVQLRDDLPLAALKVREYALRECKHLSMPSPGL